MNAGKNVRAEAHVIRSGYDGRKCLVHARCCRKDRLMVATAQYLNVKGSDLFSGICLSTSEDGGKNWSAFVSQEGLKPIEEGNDIFVGCDATPMYHAQSGKIILLGHTAHYRKGEMAPTGKYRKTFYSVYDEAKNCFSKMKFLEMPEGYENCGNGSGQSLILRNGELLIPVYYDTGKKGLLASTVLRCSFDGETVRLLEMGNSLSLPFGRGLCEPSLAMQGGTYYMTLRNDECAMVAKSSDGLFFEDLQLWKWEDGSLLANYNTQQHWMHLGKELYLVYTRRGADNDHVFRHRAPLFAAKVKDMRLIRESEIICVPERGARLGNFGVCTMDERTSAVMAAEWMQPEGCEKYGSDNAIYISFVKEE